MNGQEIRREFLEYFRKNGHEVVSSSPLIPVGDPTLLFTNAGMVQFKGVFVGEEKKQYKRAASCQKCLRVSGKHNDLENVGHTARHHTFFEMLGNFSFGNYFKREAIRFAWELLVDIFKLPKDKLLASIYEKDDEAEKIWRAEIGLDAKKIVRLGEQDNFWAMGDVGPCGPCSEIIFDQGADVGCKRPTCSPACDCDRYLELWNLVFMQFNRDSSGKMTPLPAPSIDTGMGLERIAAVMQGKKSNFESDLLFPLIELTCNLSKASYGDDEALDVSLRVIADHARAIAFLIADGILPSNEGRGYVLRRIMRRAARHGIKLGFSQPFLFRVAGKVVEMMGQAYSELFDRREVIARVAKGEEERFLKTLETGLKLLDDEINNLKERGETVFSGDIAFKLYDTYGFPLDMTIDILREQGLSLEQSAFDSSLERQKETSKKAWKGAAQKEATDWHRLLVQRGVSVEFTGYEGFESVAKIVAMGVDGIDKKSISAGERAEIVCDKTPFYGEMGGQVGDTGEITGPSGKAVVVDTRHPITGLIVHIVEVKEGSFKIGDSVKLTVDAQRRRDIMRHHTATHLLHYALRKVLGEEATQAGSVVAPDKFRFDFNHYGAVNERELKRIEEIVNEKIMEDLPVFWQILAIDEALEAGAIALFGEKYSETVRMVEVLGISRELCGGTHVKRTGEIGSFKIVQESAVAAGMRRIEAVCGLAALRHEWQNEEILDRAAGILKCAISDIPDKVEKLLAQLKDKDKEIEKIQSQVVARGARDFSKDIREVAGLKVLSTRIDASDAKTLRTLINQIKEQLKLDVVCLGAEADNKAMIAVLVDDRLTKKIPAGTIVREVAPIVGGGGGGKPDLAQAGGPNPEKLDDALNKALDVIAKLAGG